MNPHPHDAATTVDQLRTALAAHGVTLPSLGIELSSLAAHYGTPPLIALGNCNMATARLLTEALRRAATTR
ncbi:hypothetical protein ACFYXH_02170 [Streptomyces sp. NPDC002730]|uniref:hypothetical protein n=1 Tax=Streptomyces sp. NPDC002730 TaxID=3364662 RepID=UPI0036C50DC8